MNKILLLSFGCLLTFLVSCSDSSESVSNHTSDQDAGDLADLSDEVCTPSSTPSGNTLVVYSLRPDSIRLFAGDAVLYDYGSQFFAVDDTCHVWAFDTNREHGEWSNHIMGRVAPTLVNELIERLEVETWTGIGMKENGVSHAAQTVIQVGDKTYFALCSSCTDPVFKPAFVAREWLADLQTQLEENEAVPPALWYLAETVPPERYERVDVLHDLPEGFNPVAYSYGEMLEKGYGEGELIDDPDIVAALWEVRSSYLDMSETQWWYSYIPFLLPNGEKVMMRFRRSIPEIEGANGLLNAEIEHTAQLERSAEQLSSSD